MITTPDKSLHIPRNGFTAGCWIGNEILNSFEPHGFIGLAFYDSGARSIYNSIRPVRSIADIEGLRIRVQQAELEVGWRGVPPLHADAAPLSLAAGVLSAGRASWLYRALREPGIVTYYYDGADIGSVTSGITSAPMFLILSYASGDPYQAPAAMRVDYMRVWQHP